jgi:hypothetical protein
MLCAERRRWSAWLGFCTSMQRPESDIVLENCRAWLEWAAAQVDACLADDKPACDQLLGSLAKLLDPADSTVIQKTSAVVVAVQSHDRVMQRLTHVSQSLRRLKEHLGDAGRAQSPESWRMLRENQFRAFSMAEERALFLRIAAHGDVTGLESAPNLLGTANPEETIEIFLPERGHDQP